MDRAGPARRHTECCVTIVSQQMLPSRFHTATLRVVPWAADRVSSHATLTTLHYSKHFTFLMCSADLQHCLVTRLRCTHHLFSVILGTIKRPGAAVRLHLHPVPLTVTDYSRMLGENAVKLPMHGQLVALQKCPFGKKIHNGGCSFVTFLLLPCGRKAGLLGQGLW